MYYMYLEVHSLMFVNQNYSYMGSSAWSWAIFGEDFEGKKLPFFQ